MRPIIACLSFLILQATASAQEPLSRLMDELNWMAVLLSLKRNGFREGSRGTRIFTDQHGSSLLQSVLIREDPCPMRASV